MEKIVKEFLENKYVKNILRQISIILSFSINRNFKLNKKIDIFKIIYLNRLGKFIKKIQIINTQKSLSEIVQIIREKNWKYS